MDPHNMGDITEQILPEREENQSERESGEKAVA
jgi:hypothetical protein